MSNIFILINRLKVKIKLGIAYMSVKLNNLLIIDIEKGKYCKILKKPLKILISNWKKSCPGLLWIWKLRSDLYIEKGRIYAELGKIAIISGGTPNEFEKWAILLFIFFQNFDEAKFWLILRKLYWQNSINSI